MIIIGGFMSTKDRGFASMDQKTKEEIAHKGGEARKKELGPEGYSEMGKKGGEARKQNMSHEDYQEMGKKGGESRSSGSNKRKDDNNNEDTYDGE
jgi:hypothetical protein